MDVQMSLRGLLSGFGLKVGATTPSRFAGRIRDLVEGNATSFSRHAVSRARRSPRRFRSAGSAGPLLSASAMPPSI
jgi:hypothetical protein